MRAHHFLLVVIDYSFSHTLIPIKSQLSHPNLVKLIGVVKHQLVNTGDKFEISLVTEFMPKGSLLDYLTSRGRSVLTPKELLEFVM